MSDQMQNKIAAALGEGGGTAWVLPDEIRRHMLLEQYKLYVEMADRISARRQNANTFAHSINAALIGFLSFLQAKGDAINNGEILIVIACAGMILNWVWYRMVRSYRDLNTAKFLVIHQIESGLAIRPYAAEWEAVGRGEDRKLYLPFTHIEIWVPWLFFALHFIVGIYGVYGVVWFGAL